MNPERAPYKAPKNVKWIIRLHTHLFRLDRPVRIPCPNCRHWFMEANAASIEIINDFGIRKGELLPSDKWIQVPHNCGAKITVYWSE